MRMSLNRTVYYCEQVMPKFPRMNSWVSRRVRSNQFHLLWWLSMFLVLSCCCSEWWIWPSVTPDVRTTKIWKQIAAHFSCFSKKFGVSWNSSLNWCCGSLVFDLRTSLFWIVLPWLLMFIPPTSENKLQPITVSFLKICCIAEFQFEMILWIDGFQLLEDFFVLNQWKGLLPWIRGFPVSLRWVS